MPHQVSLDVFEGPIDLLLNLITRRRLDIYDVSLAAVTDDYLAAVAGMEEHDLETATGFLVVAAALLELKSARLLPAQASDEAGPGLYEERDLLLARLVECATLRSAGEWLAAGLNAGASRHGRAVPLEPRFEALRPDVLAGLAIGDLGGAAARALARVAGPREIDTSFVAPIRASVRDAIQEVAGRLGGGPLRFEDLCGPRDPKIAVVVKFLALLELVKLDAIELYQDDPLGDIRARWTGRMSPEAAWRAADDVTAEATSQ